MYKNIYLNLEELEDSRDVVQFTVDTIELDSGVNMDIKGVYTPGSYNRDPMVNLKLAYRGTAFLYSLFSMLDKIFSISTS